MSVIKDKICLIALKHCSENNLKLYSWSEFLLFCTSTKQDFPCLDGSPQSIWLWMPT